MPISELFNSIYEDLREVAVGGYGNHKKKNAINAANTALIETRMYLKQLKESKTKDNIKEQYLSELWKDAAIKFAELRRPDNAEAFLYKSQFWADSDNTANNDEIGNYRTSLNGVAKQLREALRELYQVE